MLFTKLQATLPAKNDLREKGNLEFKRFHLRLFKNSLLKSLFTNLRKFVFIIRSLDDENLPFVGFVLKPWKCAHELKERYCFTIALFSFQGDTRDAITMRRGSRACFSSECCTGDKSRATTPVNVFPTHHNSVRGRTNGKFRFSSFCHNLSCNRRISQFWSTFSIHCTTWVFILIGMTEKLTNKMRPMYFSHYRNISSSTFIKLAFSISWA